LENQNPIVPNDCFDTNTSEYLKTLDFHLNIHLNNFCTETEAYKLKSELINMKREERRQEKMMKQLESKPISKQTLKLGGKRL